MRHIKFLHSVVRAVACTALLLGLGGVTLANRAPLTVVVQPPILAESVQQSVDTAGSEFVGLAGGGLDRKLASNDIIVSGLRPTDRTLCVNILKSSGLYRATFEYPLRQPVSEIRFQLRSTNLSHMKMTGAEIAIRAQASAGARCNSAAPFLSVRWAGSQLAGNAVLFNSRQGTEVTATTIGGGYVSCQSIRDAANDQGLPIRSFDTVCYAPASRSCKSEQGIRVSRADGLEADKPKVLLIRNPC